MAKTNAQKQKGIRQDALRQWLSEKCTAQHLVNNIHKIEELDPESETFTNELSKLKTANEQRLKVMNKYIPDLKQAEVDMNHGVQDTLFQLLQEIDGTAGVIDDD